MASLSLHYMQGNGFDAKSELNYWNLSFLVIESKKNNDSLKSLIFLYFPFIETQRTNISMTDLLDLEDKTGKWSK